MPGVPSKERDVLSLYETCRNVSDGAPRYKRLVTIMCTVINVQKKGLKICFYKKKNKKNKFCYMYVGNA